MILSDHSSLSTKIEPAQRAALVHLLDAYDEATRLQWDVWQFAMELPVLRRAGLTVTALRSLIARGLAAHAREVTRPLASQRTVRKLAHLHFSEQSCFTLTEAGAKLARCLTGWKPAPAILGNGHARREQVLPTFLVCENGSRELRIRTNVIKRFRAPAENQELLLHAFQEQQWSQRIWDPITPRVGIDSKRRLHDAIARLNRNHVRRGWLRFHGDGTGKAVYWELLRSVANRRSTDRQHTAG
jgi:hypothetical protein